MCTEPNHAEAEIFVCGLSYVRNSPSESQSKRGTGGGWCVCVCGGDCWFVVQLLDQLESDEELMKKRTQHKDSYGVACLRETTERLQLIHNTITITHCKH